VSTRKRAKKRNYKAEYKRRIARAKARGFSVSQARGHAKPTELSITAENMRMVVGKDAKRVFGRKPKRLPGEDVFAYPERLEEMKKREGQFQWLDESAFIESITKLGLTEREAYTLWFSP
jgi:hypothetical protein